MKPTNNDEFLKYLMKIKEVRDALAALGKTIIKDLKPVIAAINKANKAIEKEEKRRKKWKKKKPLS